MMDKDNRLPIENSLRKILSIYLGRFFLIIAVIFPILLLLGLGSILLKLSDSFSSPIFPARMLGYLLITSLIIISVFNIIQIFKKSYKDKNIISLMSTLKVFIDQIIIVLFTLLLVCILQIILLFTNYLFGIIKSMF